MVWSNVRVSILIALALAACSDDSRRKARGSGDGDDPTGQPGERDGGSERPDGAVEPMSAACEALHGETVFQSEAFATQVLDARASTEGYVALLLAEKAALDAPVQQSLRLVRTPTGPAARDVAVGGEVLALSDVRAGRMLAVRSDGESFGAPSLDAIDLASGQVAAGAPLEDASGAPRVHYDEAGQVAHQVSGRTISVVQGSFAQQALQVALLEDGGAAVLALVSDALPTQGLAIGVYLFVFEPDGRFRARAHVKTLREGLLGGAVLAAGPDDRLHVLTAVQRSERAGFERIHARTLQTPDFERLPVVLSFSPAGVLEALREAAPADCARPLDATASALDVDADGLAWAGRCQGEKIFLATAAAAPTSEVGTTLLTLGTTQSVSSVLRHASGAVYVAGARNYAQVETGSVTAPGDAVLARIEPDGSASLTCPYDTARNDAFTLRRSARPLMILQYDAGITHSALEDTAAHSVVRYVAP